MAEIIEASSVIVKYHMRSVLPGLGSMSGLWLRCYVNRWNDNVRGSTREVLSSKALTRRQALDYIKKHGFELLMRNTDGEAYGTPDGTFRDYCRAHRLTPAEDMGYATIYDKEKEL